MPADPAASDSPASFPRRQATTRRFTLGAPRRPTVSPDGARVVLLRSRAGDDPVTCLWLVDVATGEEHLLVDPRELDVPGEEDLPPEERARRERVREQSGGVVEYALDAAARLAVFVLSGRAFTVELVPGAQPAALPVDGPVVDPRPDPTGARVAFVRGGTLHVHELSTGTTHVLAGPDPEDGPHIKWGLAEFVAAEEMNRYRGYWWSPDGSQLAVARVDDAAVTRWWIADPAHPDRRPVENAYPAAGTANAEVTLHLVDLDGTRVPVDLGEGTEYLADVTWNTHDLLVTVSTRDQRRVDVRRVDPDEGTSAVLVSDEDAVWVDLVGGVPAHLADGSLVRCADRDDTRRLLIGDEPVSPPGLQVQAVADVDGDVVLFSAAERPEDRTLWTWSRADGAARVGPQHGVWGGRRAGGTTVIAGGDLDTDGTRTTVVRADGRTFAVTSHAESPGLEPAVRRVATDPGGPSVAVLLPRDHVPGSRKLPVLLDPYGGPHSQRVLATRGMFLTSQWFADQGFAVVVADGRGTPGRGPAYERAVRGDLATPVLEDQVTALHAAAEQVGDLDLDRVGIRGWSFGGYLAALAVLRRPDVFHAAVAGAPVTDWRLYDTHYTERYLGHPDEDPEAYARSSILDDPGTREPQRPIMVVHGLADDNVVAAHTLRLSSALLAAGHPHTVLPLSGVTHMTPQEVVAENLLLLQVAFLRDALG
ncbi:S9 family peptidase [Actinomycetospora straminea]|uniref:Prolyl oligopeptidase family serine peptidase n=1 Tax=Actinomycetospora straminea TaxID=663607 RepID=A0ABP9EUS9_9PSEU|nr:prolyl oligopeptidase family serine peptidase [Actinomycetospora straminea]MDD7934837.1 prolyl oligopeptidase family serine peptidase [Actinomycetospora straminea]